MIFSREHEFALEEAKVSSDLPELNFLMLLLYKVYLSLCMQRHVHHVLHCHLHVIQRFLLSALSTASMPLPNCKLRSPSASTAP